ncbi:hypothetical protein U6Q21_12410, partial [Cutibacterium acnes]
GDAAVEMDMYSQRTLINGQPVSSGLIEDTGAFSAADDIMPITVTEAEIDYDRDGTAETLYVRMTDGERIEETAPGPFMGEYWEGRFRLELVSHEGTLLHTLELNPSFGEERLMFASSREFQLAFADYNDDGFPDFSIGQYASSNGFIYNVYSLMPDGMIVLHRDLFAARGAYSVLFEKAGAAAFRNRFYDNAKGEYAEAIYVWQGDRFVRDTVE